MHMSPTFAGMQIDLHCWVPPGVQDLPSNNIQYRHPKKQDRIYMTSQFPRHFPVFSDNQVPWARIGGTGEHSNHKKSKNI